METYTLIPYSLRNEQLTCKFSLQDCPSFQVNDWDLTLFFPASRILLSLFKNKNFTNEEILNISFINDKEFAHWLRYVSIHSFSINQSLFVPFVDQDFQFDLQIQTNQKTFFQRHQQAKEFNIINLFQTGQNTDCLGFKHQHPDYIIFHLQDYMPFQDIDEGIYGGWLIKNQEKWSHYYIPRGQFPSDQVLKSVKGIFIPGARYCSFDFSLPWMPVLHQFIRKVYEEFPCIKLVGICLGHQTINHALGGVASKNPNGNFIFGVERYQYFLSEEGPEEVVVMECHGDCVNETFPMVREKCGSQTAKYEITKNERVFTIQGHPEFNGYWYRKFYAPYLYRGQELSQEYKEQLLN